MLGPGRYLLGVLEILWLAGFATLGALALRRRLLPNFSGAPSLLATAVVALALLLWPAELLGSFGAFNPVPYLVFTATLGLGLWLGLDRRRNARSAGGVGRGGSRTNRGSPTGPPSPTTGPAVERFRPLSIATLVSLLIAAIAFVNFAAGVKTRLGTGLTGFDSTWYHGP